MNTGDRRRTPLRRRWITQGSSGGDGENHRHVIRLEAVPMRFGGFRYYAFCPRWGRRCEVLPIVGGVVACRQFHRLTYASQSMDRLARLREKAERCEKQLRQRPRRGANRRRLVNARLEADEAFEQLFAVEGCGGSVACFSRQSCCLTDS